MDPETVKASLLTLTILGAICFVLWYKWGDDIAFQYKLIMAKINPTPKGDAALIEAAFAPPTTLKSAFGNLFQSKGAVIPVDETDYYNDKKFWRQEDE